MRVAFSFYGPNGLGGPATWVRRMLPRLSRRGIDVVAVPFHTASGDCAVVTDLRRAEVPVHVVDAAGVSEVAGVNRMLQTLAAVRPDVIVADHVIPAFLGGRWAATLGIPSVMVVRGNDPWYHHLMETFLAGDDGRHVRAVVAVSGELASSAARLARSTVEVMRCPSGTPLPAETARWRGDRFHAVYSGRLEATEKRAGEVVQALLAASRALTGFSASIVGDGPLRQEIQATLASEPGHRVSYAGRLAPEAVLPHLLDAQALVLLSASEGLSSAVQEAMACGVPVVARRTRSGTDGVLNHGETAWLVHDDSEVTQAIAGLMRSESLWRKLSLGARALAVREFDIERAADRWCSLLRRLGEGTGWPSALIPAAGDAERLWTEYLTGQQVLAAHQLEFLLDRGRCSAALVERFLESRDNAWDERRCLLHRAARRDVLDSAVVTGHARRLAAEAAGEVSEDIRYRVAGLYRSAGDVGVARQIFADLAASSADTRLRAGSLFHLADTSRLLGRLDEAVALLEECLSLEPGHRAAMALYEDMVPVSASHG